jgi:hypothetical protein
MSIGKAPFCQKAGSLVGYRDTRSMMGSWGQCSQYQIQKQNWGCEVAHTPLPWIAIIKAMSSPFDVAHATIA